MGSYKEQRHRGSQDIVYIVCPLCGRNRVFESQRAKEKGKEELRWDFFNPETGLLVQIRQAGGKMPHEEQPEAGVRKRGGARAYGFPLKHGITLKEARENGYDSQFEAIKLQINKLAQYINQI
jgi:hypothetical protein